MSAFQKAVKREATKQQLRKLPGRERFWELCGKRKGCWSWMGTRDKDGYGCLKVDGHTVRAHRLSYEINYGPVGESLVLHSCDNPGCCNPNHLHLGSAATNAAERHSKGRDGSHRGALNGRAKLNNSQIEEIRRIGKSKTQREISRAFGVTDVMVSKILSGKAWA